MAAEVLTQASTVIAVLGCNTDDGNTVVPPTGMLA